MLPQKEKRKIPYSRSTHSPVPPDLTLSLNFPLLDILHKGNHRAGGLLRLASFTRHRVFEVRPCGSLHQPFTFPGSAILHCVGPHGSSPSAGGHFPLVVNSPA